MAKRPPIPVDLHRIVLIEAGHRCAIHTCRQVPVEIAHIDPWSRCREHRFENLIALCPTCHTRIDLVGASPHCTGVDDIWIRHLGQNGKTGFEFTRKGIRCIILTALGTSNKGNKWKKN